ncbi:esterase, partial [Rhizobium lusitanum]|nr:esterase [Rhizobium lusitanum]
MRGITVVILLFTSAGCGGHLKNVLIPVADSSPKSTKVDMLVTTTRSRSTVQGEMFTGERALTP